LDQLTWVTFGFYTHPIITFFIAAGLPKIEATTTAPSTVKVDRVVVKESCGDLNTDDDDDEMEQEEMFVEAHEGFESRALEWGGPRRGGRLPEPTRYGDWERKGRCSDF
jgi:hypothetical protein